MAIVTTTTWGRTLNSAKQALVQAQLDAMSAAGLTDGSPDPGVDPEIRTWADIDSATAWQTWTQAGSITPGPIGTQIAFP